MSETHDSEPDLTFIAPERRGLIAARIAVLERYLALEAPTITDADALAAELSIATSSFYALARAWKRNRDPKALRGAGVRRMRQKHELGDEKFLRKHLAASDHARTIEQEVLKLEAAAKAQDAKVRSRSALRRFVEAYRREAGILSKPTMGDLAIDYSAIDIPVLEPVTNNAVLPVAAVLIHVSTATIIAAELSFDPPSPRTAASLILKAINQAQIGDFNTNAMMVGSIRMTIDRHEEWSNLIHTLAEHGIFRLGKATPVRITTGLIQQLLDRRIAGFKTHDRLAFLQSQDRPSRVARGRVSISLAQAESALDQRLVTLPRPRLCLPPKAGARQLVEALQERARVQS